MREEVQDHIARLPGRKLVHSIGTPVGGSTEVHAAQIPLLKQAIERFESPWASEHLSFNLTPDFFTGFFLPPRQTDQGLKTCVEAIRRLRNGLGVPLAVETGVNYFRPRDDEIPDGQFIAALVEAADCGILLDLHNLYCNQLNGRQTIDRFLSQISLERVWEVHLAGGFELEGFWLDAHSGSIPPPLEELCRTVIPTLPNLKAIVFELFSSFLPRFGLEATRRELEKVHELWALRRLTAPPRKRPVPRHVTVSDDRITPARWERAVGSLVIGRAPADELETEIASDPGVKLTQGLIKEFRASMVVAVYRLTSRLLMLALGPDVFRALLEDFWSKTPPHQFAGTEADAFADYLVSTGLRLPQLQPILAFERAALATLRDGETRVVRFEVPPLPMLGALAEGILLQNPGDPGDYEIELTADGPIRINGMTVEAVGGTFPFH